MAESSGHKHFQDRPDVHAVRSSCAVCGAGRLQSVLDLPQLPVTGIFSRECPEQTGGGYDQEFLICPDCGHGQLAVELDPACVYGSSYSFRTSESQTAQRGTLFFLDFLRSLTGNRNLSCVVDVGCNDLHLLKSFRGQARHLVGIDPIWRGREEANADADITVVGKAVEEVDLKAVLPEVPDLILCRHTLEHIFNPRSLLQRLLSCADAHTICVFEFPCLDSLIERLRFDQVFHQHLQYFSLASVERLFSEVGGSMSAYRHNFHDWGAVAVAFTKNERSPAGQFRTIAAPAVTAAFSVFKAQITAAKSVLDHLRTLAQPWYAYGAAQMLPVLAYHLNDQFEGCRAVLDDDPAKNGAYYSNLTLPIRQADQVRDLAEANVVITAVDNAVPILKKLFTVRPRQIVCPFSWF